MVYCIVNELDYRSSFNIFAVIAGVLLLRQSLRTARVVAWFAAFLLAGFAGAAIIFPLLTPLDLWAVQFRLHPLSMLSTIVIAVAVIGFVFWVYRNLTSAVVVVAWRSAGIAANKPILPFVIGAALVIGLSAMMVVMTRGESAEIAKRKAQEQLGSNYKYHVTAMNWSRSGGSATLTAYNERELKEVKVRW
jgi:hypothetical protein